MNTQPYEYVTVRYVHDPVADECLNIGIMLLSVTPEETFFAAKFDSRYGHLSEHLLGSMAITTVSSCIAYNSKSSV